MRKPASYARAACWGAGIGAAIALSGFALARLFANVQIGVGAYMQMQNGVLTPYGWERAVQRNMVFVAFCIGIALMVRAIIGPGRKIT